MTRKCCRDISAFIDQQSLKEEKRILNESRETGIYTLTYYRIRVNAILRPIFYSIAVVILFAVVVIGSCSLATTHVIFNAVLLYRGYSYYLNRDFVFLNRIHLFLQTLLLDSKISTILYPFEYSINWLSNISIDFRSVQINCFGSQAPAYLLVDFLIASIVVLNITSNSHVFWLTMVTECTSEFGKLLTNRFYLRKGVCNSACTFMYVIGGVILRIFPSPMKINQYLLSFVYISVFFSNSGVSSSSKNCDVAIGFPLDSIEAVLTSLLVIFLILPMVYLFGQVLYPKPFTYDYADNRSIDGGMCKADDSESFYHSVLLFVESLGIDFERLWRYMNAWISFDWFFVKSLIIFAQSLERNMHAFLATTCENLTTTPSLSTLPLIAELEYYVAVILLNTVLRLILF